MVVETRSGKRRGCGPHSDHLSVDLPESLGEGVGRYICIPVIKTRAGPENAMPCRRPDPEERAAVWQGEAPPFDEVGHRGMYDVNKKLIDDLSGRVSAKIGRLTVRTLRG